MDSVLALHRFHFAFTITFHYLFAQLTMGLALLIFVLKSIALRTDDDRYNHAARFWIKIFAITFAVGVVTGVPMEFQFGTNWSRFSRYAGGVIGQTLAMEGVFAFFLESSFLGLLIYGENRLGRKLRWLTSLVLFAGTWLSGFFIVATDAWMQHPVAFQRLPDGSFQLTSFTGLLLNPWAWIQYAHTMCGAVTTGAFVMAAVGAFYVLSRKHEEQGRIFLRLGVTAGLIATIAQIFPTGDVHGRYMAQHQPATTAGMEALFHSQPGAPLVIIGQPDVEKKRIDNPLVANKVLSLLIYGTTTAEVAGLDKFPVEDWPTNIPLLFFGYHVMAGLGTIFVALMGAAAFALWRGALFRARWLLWCLMLAFPLPYIANTAGWFTAEIGRQPWLVYGLLRTEHGASPNVSAGNGIFTLLGFMGVYTLLSIFILFLQYRQIEQGPTAGADQGYLEPTITGGKA
jgi:cytochrome d ubiquinol oxidase subunit I